MPLPDSSIARRLRGSSAQASLAHPPGILIALVTIEVLVYFAIEFAEGGWSALGGVFLGVGLVATTVVCLREEDAEEPQKAADAPLRLRQQAAVAGLSHRALAAPDFGTIAADAVRTTAETCDLSLVALIRTVDGGRGMVPVQAIGSSGELWSAGAGDDHLRHTLAERGPIVCGDLRAERRFDASALVDLGLLSSMTALIPRPDGEPFGVMGAYSPALDRFGEEDVDFLQTIANVLSSALAREQAQADMLHSSLHDPVTHLPNLALLMDRVEQAVGRLARSDGLVAALVLGIDHFKDIINTCGHQAGDDALQQVAERLARSMRSEDTLARGTGDEFVVLCEGMVSPTAAGPIAERLLEAVAEPFVVSGVEFGVTLSIGVAVAGSDWDQSPDALLRDADAAMHRAKALGRNRYELFDEGLRAQTASHAGVRSGLRRAVRDSQLRVVYQPIIDLRTGRLSGMEALVRWEHPQRGLLGPVDFISIAEESDVVTEIDGWVTNEACRQFSHWRRQRPDLFNGTRMAINLSGRDLCSADLTRTVAGAIAASGIRAQHLVFEITESSLVPDPERADVVLSGMKSLGVQLALDDFGTGHSSLLHLKRFPFDIVKLDRSFVGGLATATADFAIVASVIGLARTLGLSVVAEGIESEIQLSRLRQLGCPFGQGYLFSAPVSPRDLLPVVERPVALPEGSVT